VNPGTGARKVAPYELVRHMFAFSSTVLKSEFAVTSQYATAPCRVMAKSADRVPELYRERSDPEFPGEEQSNDDIIIQHAPA
jgi:hypothetical protein